MYWEDTDAGGVVYYANYLKFPRARAHRVAALARLRAAELREGPRSDLRGRERNIDYRRPARLDDGWYHLRVPHEGAASMSFAQQILPGRGSAHRGALRVACIDAQSFRPKRLPPALVNADRAE